MLVDESHTVLELEFIDCWNSKFCTNFVNCYETFFETRDQKIYPKNPIKIYQYKGNVCNYVYSNKKYYCSSFLIKYKGIICMEINSNVYQSSTIYNIKYENFDIIPIYDIIVKLKLPEFIHKCILEFVI
jgi:hypothetical protein